GISTKGPVALGPMRWIFRARRDLPVPGSPRIRTALGLAATREARARTLDMWESAVTSFSRGRELASIAGGYSSLLAEAVLREREAVGDLSLKSSSKGFRGASPQRRSRLKKDLFSPVKMWTTKSMKSIRTHSPWR